LLGGSDAIHLSEKSLAVVLGVIVDVLINVSRYRLQLRVQIWCRIYRCLVSSVHVARCIAKLHVFEHHVERGDAELDRTRR